MSDIQVRPVTPDQHDALMHFFDMVAYADNPNWSKCYCMERLVSDYDARTREQNRADRSALLRSGRANGLVAYRLGRLVGWCHAAPKAGLLGLAGPADATTGAIVCFVVAPDQRRQRVAAALLEGALAYLKERGMSEVEAYPRSGNFEPARWPWVNYLGPLPMYLKAGFTVVSDHGDWALMRRAL